MNPHSVQIIHNRRYCKVKPGEVLAKVGEKIKWTAPKDSPLTLFFPNEKLFGNHFETIPEKGYKELQVQEVDGGEYPYAAYCETDNEFAEGGSTPIIIIEK